MAIKAREITWTQTDHPHGEFWVGTIGGRTVADVFGPRSASKPHYTLRLGDSGEWGDAATIESAKRSAQKALNKVVQVLIGESA